MSEYIVLEYRIPGQTEWLPLNNEFRCNNWEYRIRRFVPEDASVLRELRAEIASLRSALEAAREALKPFAAAAGRLPISLLDTHGVIVPDMHYGEWNVCSLGDLRRAAAALAAVRKE